MRASPGLIRPSSAGEGGGGGQTCGGAPLSVAGTARVVAGGEDPVLGHLITRLLPAAVACGDLRPNRPHCMRGMGADMLPGGELNLGPRWFGPVRQQPRRYKESLRRPGVCSRTTKLLFRPRKEVRLNPPQTGPGLRASQRRREAVFGIL